MQIERATCKQLREHMVEYGVQDNNLLFTSTAGTLLSRNNVRTKFWAPAVQAAKLDGDITVSSRDSRTPGGHDARACM